MSIDNMIGITKGSYTGGDLFCKSQLITCNRVKECNGVCPFEDAIRHADREQSLNEQNIDHDREWIIGCIEHDGFIHTHRFDKANQIIHDALSDNTVQGEWKPFDLTWGRNVYFCTACKESTEVPTVNGQPSYNFCPNCGARMYKGGDTE